MTSPNLEGLARTGELKAELFTLQEFASLLRLAKDLLADAKRPDISPESRFSLAYGASHALAGAALRLHGYRSGNRYLVFQCLEHTAGLSPLQCRLFSLCHERRNKAEYHGAFDVEEALLEDLTRAAGDLLERVSGMAPPD
jgi:hypothetical protein